jgi:hypothetical protein
MTDEISQMTVNMLRDKLNKCDVGRCFCCGDVATTGMIAIRSGLLAVPTIIKLPICSLHASLNSQLTYSMSSVRLNTIGMLIIFKLVSSLFSFVQMKNS